MSDARLRELERRAAAGGPEDQERLAEAKCRAELGCLPGAPLFELAAAGKQLARLDHVAGGSVRWSFVVKLCRLGRLYCVTNPPLCNTSPCCGAVHQADGLDVHIRSWSGGADVLIGPPYVHAQSLFLPRA